MTDTSKFWNKIARKYAETPIRQQEAYQAKLDHTQTFFKPNTRLFEFGCGTGTTALYHAPKVASILATDISSEMLAIADEKKAKAGVENIQFKRWNIDTDPIPDVGFDVIMAHSILHLVEDMPSALQKTNDMLKPGGLFISSTVCLGDWNFVIRLALPIMKLIGKAPKTVSFFKKEDLREAFLTSGYEILDLPKKDWGAAQFIVAQKT